MNEESLQAENILFFRNLDSCCQKIAEQTGNQDIASWKNSDYVKLSGLLYRKTKVHLGENTLKRIFGKVKTSNRYYPQKATRDALAQFIDFRDWQEFERINSLTIEKPPLPKPTQSKEPVKPSKRAKHTLKVILFAITVLVGISLWIYIKSLISDQDIKLLCLNPNGISPHSALFKLNVKNNAKINRAEYLIDFADGSTMKKSFSANLVNHYYEAPGRYFPVLFHHKKPIDTGWVYLQSKGWDLIAMVEHDTTRVYPVSSAALQNGKRISASTSALIKSGVDTTKTFFVSFANVKPTTISADNFELNVFIQTSPSRPGVRCSQTDLIVYGEKDFHAVNLIKPECVVWSNLKFSENQLDGTKDDLRPQGQDLRNGKHIKLRIENQHARLFVDNREIINSRYKIPIGKLMGVKIRFAGVGSFENFEAYDLKTKEKF
ncbi:hypothetical protein G7074_24195 [Pedobacter sp. HDW13]|uniref:hypothetical protein n=1 Tax=Pedobacter sp. HDW13 TaxID=2714940 RepID=UPI001409E772|nr:hypothetical protein [Pedobacter sp. HDW13]QIL42093.1 hypothetical protein G7074_24195 [Pedobacter sp. HDW13]